MDSGGRGTYGIVLAGSYPWSDSLLEKVRPRPLLPVADQPLISYPLDWLEAAGIHEVVVCLNPASGRLRGWITAHRRPGLDCREDVLPRGPAGSARDAALATTGETFVVTDGTSIPTFELDGLLRAHRVSGVTATVAVYYDRPGSGGTQMPSPTGVYVFERRAFDLVPASGFHDIKEHLIPRLYREGGRVSAYAAHTMCPRVLNTQTYLAINQWMVSRLADQPQSPDGYDARSSVLVHAEAQVDNGARLVGPLIIGPGTTVMGGATVVGPMVLGSACTVEAGAVVSRSVLWDRCRIGAHAIVDGCVLVDEAGVKPGASLSGTVMLPAARRDGQSQTVGARMLQAAFFALRPRPAGR